MKIAVIGAGAMGGATVEGLIKGQQFKNEDITVSDPSQAVVDKFAKTGVSVTTDNKLAAETADIVCVVVKPWLVERVLKDIKPELNPKKQILIVIAGARAEGHQTRTESQEADPDCDCSRCEVGEHQGVARGTVPDAVPGNPEYRHCRDGLDDLHRACGSF